MEHDYATFLEKEGLVIRKCRELAPEEKEQLAKEKISAEGVKYCWMEKKSLNEWTTTQLQTAMQFIDKEVEEKIQYLNGLHQQLKEAKDLKVAAKLEDEIQLTGRLIAVKEKELEELNREFRKRQK
ncbi:MAG: hypothetical protein ACUVUF_02300 [Candidatus Bathycorpusculaceae bacterium]